MEQVIAGNKTLGVLDRGIYVTRRHSKEHFFRKGKGYAIGVKLLTELQAKGCTHIKIIETTQKGEVREYLYTVQEYLDAPQYHEREYELQRCAYLLASHRIA